MTRRFLALVRTSFVESLAEPLSAVLFLSALVMVHLLPVLHCHQFGEAGRLARECGLSVVLVFGISFAVSAAVRTIGQELELGTAAVALALPVPRPMFFCAKVAGVLGAFALFAFAVLAAASLAVLSAEVAAQMAVEHGDASQTWGPGFAAGLGATLLAMAAAAAANHLLRWRFCLWACLMLAASQPLALAVAAFVFGAGMPHGFGGLAAAMVALVSGCSVFVVMAGGFAVRLKPAATSALTTVAVLLAFLRPPRFVLPDINAFWLADRLADGGAPSFAEVASAAGAGLLLVVLWSIAGSALLAGREMP